MGTLRFHYVFEQGDKPPIAYDVDIDDGTLELLPTEPRTLSDWTKLGFHKCEHCPLNEDEHPHCPVAANIAHVVEEFKDHTSYDPSRVQVVAAERTYSKEVPLQYGIFSILGLIMATSDCPHMRFLKPLARFHLPFASSTETLVRTVSMFLLRQYLQSTRDKETSFDLAQLDEAYTAVNLVNKGIVARIRSIATGDADANAIVILHSLATLMSQNISEDLPEIAHYFR